MSFNDFRSYAVDAGTSSALNPLECPKCKGSMRVIALIEGAGVIRRILEHLGLWAPQVTQRSPPQGPEA